MDSKLIAFPERKSAFLVCLIGVLILLPVNVKSGVSEPSFSPQKHGSITAIYIVNHGGHAGIVLSRSKFPKRVLPERANFPNADYLEVGWGDRDYYQARDPHFGLLLKAALLPSASVLHVVGFNTKPVEFFPVSEIVRIDLTGSGMEKLVQYIGNSFARNDEGFAKVLGTGLYGHSYFYLSRENYHLFKTCNVWIAKALQTAGITVTPFTSISTDSLMKQLYEYGEIVSKKPDK